MTKTKRETPAKKTKSLKTIKPSESKICDIIGTSSNMDICPYKPLGIVIITAFFFAISHSNESSGTMGFFMGYFLCLLAMFQVFDLKGFVAGFRKYDMVSNYFHHYPSAYPFIEFILGFSLLMSWMPFVTNFLVLAISLMGAISVMRTLQLKDKLNCACLGTSFTLPLGMISLFEYAAMALMAFLNIVSA